jgi:hypothetical protein
MSTPIPRLISVSRRSDIPAYYSQWFISKVREGSCEVKNPYSGINYKVDLTPDAVLGFIFWTRNPVPIFKYLSELDERGFFYYFQFTITGYPKPLESHSLPLLASIENFKKLSLLLGKERIHWRYDPIVLSTITPLQLLIDNFLFIASSLKGYTTICSTSFLQFYKKSISNFIALEKEHKVTVREPDEETKLILIKELGKIASENEILLNSCCDPFLSGNNIPEGTCINPEWFGADHLMNKNLKFKRKPSRAGCNCFESTDIGAYDTCLSGCSYCYATKARDMALRNFNLVEPGDISMVKSDKIVETW